MGWRDRAEPVAKEEDWRSRAEPEGGAEGGGGSDRYGSKPLDKPPPVDPAEAEAKAAEEKRRMALAVSGLTRGQNIASLPEEQRDAFNTKSTEKALGQGIAAARGAPLVGSHIDELSAALQSGALGGPEYKKKLAASRGAVAQAEKDNPALPALTSMAFSPLSPASAAGRVALGTASGVSEGIGSAPTMRDSVGPAIKGGLLGLGMSALGEGIRGGGKYLGDKKGEVIAKQIADAQAKADKGFRSARGALGAEVSNGSRTLEVLEAAAAGVNPNVDPALQQAAAQFLASPEGIELRNQVLRSSLGRAGDNTGRIQNARDAMTEAVEGQSPEAVRAAAQARIDDPSALLRRVREVGPKVVLPAVGGALAGAPGAAAGGLVGSLLGRSATTVRNAIADPYVSTRLFGAGETALTGLGGATQGAVPIAAREALAPPWSSLLNEEEEQP